MSALNVNLDSPNGIAKGPEVLIYTDGACIPNPGAGGYAAVILNGNERREISGGFRRTTNNRMEMMAAIAALREVNPESSVRVFTDSQYLQKSMELGRAKNWRANGWKRKNRSILNSDLWSELLSLCEKHDVEFLWLRGHAGDSENERCDFLCSGACAAPNLSIDNGYEFQPSPDPELFDFYRGL